jgi:hypothetical protein
LRLQLDGDLHRDALEGVLEGEVDGDLDVASALAALPRAGSRRSVPGAEVLEQPSEEVGKVPQIAEVFGVPGPLVVASARRARPAEDARTQLVVLLALRRIRQEVVGALHFLEALLGLRVSRVLIRVVLPGELAVGLLDLVLRRRFGYAQGLVEIFHSPWETTTRAGRRTRSPRR